MMKNKTEQKITFIDLFAGIGGFHLSMHNIGGKCVFVSEWDEDCRKTYKENYSLISPELFIENDDGSSLFAGDITKIVPSKIPDHDVLCGGFPCQPFSQAGQKKGFEDTRGTLFFNIMTILNEKKPKAFFLENVRGLLNHDNGKTFATIKKSIESSGYSFHYKIVKASDFNLPQHRPRLFMVGFRSDICDTFAFPQPIPLEKTMKDVFDGRNVNREIGFTLRVGGKSSPIDDRRNWDGYLVDGEIVRIKPEQAKRMQGFPDTFTFPVSESAAMKQLGNSVAVNAIQAVAFEIIRVLKDNQGGDTDA